MLVLGWICIARGVGGLVLWRLSQRLLPNMGADQKKTYSLSVGSLALCHW